MFKLVLEKAEEPEIKLPTSSGSWEKQESSRKTSIFCFIDYAKAFDCVEMGIPDHLSFKTVFYKHSVEALRLLWGSMSRRENK